MSIGMATAEEGIRPGLWVRQGSDGVTGDRPKKEEIPLEGILVEAHLKGFTAKLTVSQRFVNRGPKPIEAVYVFPLDEGAAVSAFEAVVDGIRVTGKVMEREKAFEAYDDAMAAGHGAYLLDEERPDLFTLSVGNLPPGKEALIRITTVAELGLEGDAIRFVLPTTVSPRYAPEQDRTGVGRPPAEALNPPTALRVPYGLELAVTLEMPSAIRGIESPTHPLSIEIDGSRGSVRPSERLTAMDRDFVLVVKLEVPHAPRALVERDAKGRLAALLSFVPNLDEKARGPRPCEAIFLVDRSGSMGGTSIAEARNALQLCLRSLPSGSRFNVVGFGSTWEALFPESRLLDEASLREASRHVASMDADLGGTEILPALEAVLGAPPLPALPRQLFVLTDGEVTNTDEVIEAAASHADRARVFAFGIGAGSSAHLVRGLARAGRGEAEFIAPGERIEGKVMRQLGKALAPSLTDVTVDWGELEATQAPHAVPPLFDAGRILVWGLLASDHAGTVTLRAKGPDGPVAFPILLDPSAATEGNQIATLTARALIRDLEEGSPLSSQRGSRQKRGQAGGEDRVKAEIIRLGTEFGLASRETSFVAVEHRTTPLGEEAILRKVPVALTREWGGTGGSLDGSIFLCSSAPAAAPPIPPAAKSGLLGRLRRIASPGRLSAAGVRRPMFDAGDAPFSCAEEPAPWLAQSEGSSSSAASLRPLDHLVALQGADGSWEMNAELAEAIGTKLSTLEKRLAASSGSGAVARRAFATALALAWLEQHAPAERDEWRLLAEKARAWLASSGAAGADGRSLDAIAGGIV
jgi:Ca-activated chloride channel family protein